MITATRKATNREREREIATFKVKARLNGYFLEPVGFQSVSSSKTLRRRDLNDIIHFDPSNAH